MESEFIKVFDLVLKGLTAYGYDGSNPGKFNELNDLRKQITSPGDIIVDVIDSENKLTEIFTKFNTKNFNLQIMSRVVDILRDVNISTSRVSIVKISKTLVNDLLMSINLLTRKYAEYHIHIQEFIAKPVKITAVITPEILMSSFQKNPHTTTLITNIVNFVLTNNIPGAVKSGYIDLVEKLKTVALSRGIPEVINSGANVPQQMLLMNKLVPVFASKPINEALSEVGIKTSSGDIDSIIKQAIIDINKAQPRGSKIGILIIYKIIRQPYEYNAFKITKSGKINSGLNKTVIQDLTLINKLEPAKPPGVINDAIVKYDATPGEVSDKYYVFDSLNGSTFRGLSCYSGLKFMPIPAGLLPIGKVISPAPNLGYYNHILNAEIISKMVDPYIKSGEQNIESQNWKQRVFDVKRVVGSKLKFQFDVSRDKSFDTVANKFSTTSGVIVYSILDVVMENIDSLNAGHSGQFQAEYVLSYIKEFEDLNNKTREDILKLCDMFRNDIEAEIRSRGESDTKYTQSLREVYMRILEKLLSTILSGKSSIFILIENKRNLLNKISIRNT